MKTIRYRSRGEDVRVLEEILQSMDYNVFVSNYFGKDTHHAVKDFQKKNALVVDGIVGQKSWMKLLEIQDSPMENTNKFLSENDLKKFATKYGVELAAIKAVNAVESTGKGFLINGKPKILFEGHVFWRQLKERGLKPEDFLNANSKDVLYKKWTRVHYIGGSKEYNRLEKAAKLSSDKKVHDAAYSSASWGSFQIMGYHFKSLGYPSIDKFVSEMNISEAKHLDAFGKFLVANNLLTHLKNKNWAKFARGYNGSGYKTNKYDEKMKAAYERYSLI